MRNLITFIISVLILASCVPTAQEKESINSNLLDQGCEIPPSFDGHTCKGRFVATNMDELNSYLSDYGLKKGNVKHLKIDFDVVADAIQVTSPCSITVRDNASLTSTTGSSCLVAKGAVKAKGMNFSALNGNTTFASFEGNVIIDDNSTINTKNLNLIGQHKAVIQNTATINAHDISMKSFGTGEDARVHIRHSSNVTANNIYLEAKRKATLGRDSLYNVSGTIRIIGEGPDDDSENPEFATIWKGTTVNTNELIINSLSKTKVSGGITVNANRVELTGPACSIGKTAVINSPVKEGNCFSGDHPTAVLKVAKVLRTGTAPHEVSFDASRSTDNVGIISYEWKLGDIETVTTTEPNLTYTFVTPGVYKVRLKVIDGSGLFDYKTRKITVNEAPAPDGAPVAYFKFMTDEGELTTYFFGDAGSSPIVSGTYEVIGTGITQNLTDFHKRTENSFESLTPAVYQVKLSLTDSEGLTNSFTHNVDLTTDEGAPYVRFKLDQSGPRQVFLNAVDSFDPYEFREITVDWGDGSELETEESFFFTHNYSADGDYNVTVRLTGESDKFTELSKNISINNETPEILNPVANYEMFTEFEGENTGHVRFLEQYSGSPNGEIISYAWDFGDGSTGFGSDVIHFYNPGVYFATLTVTDFAGKTNAQTQRVIVTEEGANLIVEVECFEDDVRSEPGHFICDVLAVDKSEELTEISLNWGDGTVETQGAKSGVVSENRFFYKYTNSGVFDVKANAKTIRGENVESFIRLINASDSSPIAKLNCTQINFGLVECNPEGSSDDLEISEYIYDFNDGTTLSTSNELPVTHSYTSTGVRTVSLKVKDNTGQLSQSEDIEIELSERPIITISCQSEEIREVDCTVENNFTELTASSYSWGFSDGRILDGESVNFITQNDINLEVNLRVDFANNFNVENTLPIQFKKAPLPIPFISGVPIVENPLTSFTAKSDLTSYGEDSALSSIRWYLDNIEVSMEESVTLSNIPVGNHTLKLQVENNWGNSAEATKNILINGLPRITITSNSTTGDLPFTLILDASSSYDPEGKSLTFEWIDENGIVSSGATFSREYKNEGAQKISLKALDEDGAFSFQEITFTGTIGEVYLGESGNLTAIVGSLFEFTPLFQSKSENGEVEFYTLNVTDSGINHSFDTETGKFSFVPLKGDIGELSLSYTVIKGESRFNRIYKLEVIELETILTKQGLQSNESVIVNSIDGLENNLTIIMPDTIDAPTTLTVKKASSLEGTRLYFETNPPSLDPIHVKNLNPVMSYSMVGQGLSSNFLSDDISEIALLALNKITEVFISETFDPCTNKAVSRSSYLRIRDEKDQASAFPSNIINHSDNTTTKIIMSHKELENSENYSSLLESLKRLIPGKRPKTIYFLKLDKFVSMVKGSPSAHARVLYTTFGTHKVVYINADINNSRFKDSIDLQIYHELEHLNQFASIGCRNLSDIRVPLESAAEAAGVKNLILQGTSDINNTLTQQGLVDFRKYINFRFSQPSTTIPQVALRGLSSPELVYGSAFFWDYFGVGTDEFYSAYRSGISSNKKGMEALADIIIKIENQKEKNHLFYRQKLVEDLVQTSRGGQTSLTSLIGLAIDPSSKSYNLSHQRETIGALGIKFFEFPFIYRDGQGCHDSRNVIKLDNPTDNKKIFLSHQITPTEHDIYVAHLPVNEIVNKTYFNGDLYFRPDCATTSGSQNFFPSIFQISVLNESIDPTNVKVSSMEYLPKPKISDLEVEEEKIINPDHPESVTYKYTVTASGSESRDMFNRSVNSYSWSGITPSGGTTSASLFSGGFTLNCGTVYNFKLTLRVLDELGVSETQKNIFGETPDCPPSEN